MSAVLQGILPDVMHIVHLACLVDVVTSMLLDLSDTPFPWPGTSRDSRLEHGWRGYKGFCQKWGIEDRAERKLFTNEALKADYATVSQKILRAAAAKYMVFWLYDLMENLLQSQPDQPEHLKCPSQLVKTNLGSMCCIFFRASII